MNKQTQWQLRYRSPVSPTKGVDDVIIETDTDSDLDAKALAEWWLATKVASPSTRFVFVRRLVVATSDEMRRATAAKTLVEPDVDRGGSPAQAASQDTTIPSALTSEGSDETVKTKRGATPRGRVGA